jgi:hypothetical protein
MKNQINSKMMMNNISELDQDILSLMYNYGRGYCTPKIIHSYLGITYRGANKRLSLLKAQKLLKVTKIKQIYAYILTKKVIEYFSDKIDKTYLERLKTKNEITDIIIDKLKMLDYILNVNSEEKIIVMSYDKEEMYNKLYHIQQSKLKEFTVGGGENLFFNDVQYITDKEGYNNLHISLFPRDNVFPKTYIKDFILRNYYKINHLITAQNKKVTFEIIVHNEYSKRNYLSVINENKVTKNIKTKDNNIELINFYKMGSNTNELLVPIAKFQIYVTLQKKAHSFF